MRRSPEKRGSDYGMTLVLRLVVEFEYSYLLHKASLRRQNANELVINNF